MHPASSPVSGRPRIRVPSRAPADVLIRPAEPRDCPRTAELHVQQLSRGLFPLLGVRFVARWHTTIVGSQYGVALAAVRRDQDGCQEIVGFLVGAWDQERHVTETILRRGVALGAAGLRALVARPGLLLLFLRTRVLRYARRFGAALRSRSGGPPPHSPAVASRPPIGVVTAVAVDPSARRTGVGRELLDAFLHECALRGTRNAELVAAADAPALAVFYTAAGWRKVGSHVAVGGGAVHRYRIDLQPDVGPLKIIPPRKEVAP